MKVITCDQCGIQHGDEREVATLIIYVHSTMPNTHLNSQLDLCNYDATRLRNDIIAVIKRHCPNHEF